MPPGIRAHLLLLLALFIRLSFMKPPKAARVPSADVARPDSVRIFAGIWESNI
jgi:hypothetical protein